MGNRVIDLKKQLKQVKASERMVAFAGLHLDLGKANPDKDGVLKIADHVRADDSGYLTLTFMIDLDMDRESREMLSGVFTRFARFAERADTAVAVAAARFGTGFEYLMLINDGPDGGDMWFMAEVNLYYKALKGRTRELIETKIIPALAELLPARFEGVNWYEDA